MKLLLFDIDGTLVFTHGVGRRAVEAALERIFGRPITTAGVTFSGKTDPQIIKEVLEQNLLPAELIAAGFSRAVQAYAEEMEQALRGARVDVLPGAHALLERLHADPGVRLALLTGNLEPLAYSKLAAVGLDAFFPFGAFGSDSSRRDDLPAIAVARATAATGRTFSGKDIVIIGDTEHDIRCGRAVGALSVAVCTGNYSRSDLLRHEPDVVFDDLSDHDGFIQHIFAAAA